MLMLFIVNIAKLATTSTTVFDVAINFGFYCGLIITYYLAGAYLIDTFILGQLELYLKIAVFTTCVLPMISLFITIFVKSSKKKNVVDINELTGGRF